MLNPESRKYFNRVFMMSSTALAAPAIWKASQLEQIQECSKIHKMTELIKYLKTANSSVLLQCYALQITRFRSIWLPTIEDPSVFGAFMTKTPEEIYKSNEAPAMDAMFSFTTQVCDDSTIIIKK